MSQQRKFFPGWLVVASGFVIMATCYTIFVNCMSLFQPLIVSDLGITLAQYNISNAISTVVSVVGSLVIGHVADKVSGRILGSLTVIATSAVLVGMSFVGELWQVYVLFAVSGCFAVASTRLLISLVTANWFTAKRGLAISIALSGSGFGGAIRCCLHRGGTAHHRVLLPHQTLRDRPQAARRESGRPVRFYRGR